MGVYIYSHLNDWDSGIGALKIQQQWRLLMQTESNGVFSGSCFSGADKDIYRQDAKNNMMKKGFATLPLRSLRPVN